MMKKKICFIISVSFFVLFLGCIDSIDNDVNIDNSEIVDEII